MSAPTFQDLYELGRVELMTRNRNLVGNDGDVSDTLLRASAAMGDAGIGWMAGEVAGAFLSTSRGDRRTLVARDRGVERSLGTAAIGELTFTRSSTASAYTLPAGTRAGTQPDPTGAYAAFATTTDVTFGVGVASRTVAAAAAEIGRGGNVGPGTVTRVLSTLPVAMTVTNVARFVGGDARESDEDLLDRTRNDWQNRARATAAALVIAAKRAGAHTATVTRDTGTNIVTLYVTDRDGQSNAALVAAVTAELVNWQGAADVVNVVGGTVSLQAIEVTLTVRPGVSIPALIAKVRASIVAAVNRLPIGDTLYRDLISTAAKVDPSIVTVTVVTPAASITPLVGVVIRTTADLVEVG